MIKFNKKYYVDAMCGTSFGAIIGFFISIQRYDIIKQFFIELD
jgi:predicted acylesterase/phospholipase RssA